MFSRSFAGMNLKTIAKALSAQYSGADCEFTGVSIDSRTLVAGDVFLALAGEQFDGHDFIGQAIENGASALIAERAIEADLPQLIVDNSRKTLGDIAKLHRQQFSLPCVAVTGSCGKTTTKTMIAAILARRGNTLATEGTLNNDIGVPLTLLRLSAEHQLAVIEMGANHHQEIAYLTRLVSPTHAVITNAAAVHLQGFGDIDGVATAKGEIFQGLAPDGVAILNADDAHFTYWRDCLDQQQVISFGLAPDAAVRAEKIEMQPSACAKFQLVTPLGECPIELPLLGYYNIYNALAASAVAVSLRVPLLDIQFALQHMQAVNKRMNEYVGLHGSRVLDDSYNANPHSVRAAIDLLAQYSGKKVLVLGDMLELGAEEQQYHREIGDFAKHKGVDAVYAVGELTPATVAAFGRNAMHFQHRDELHRALADIAKNNMTFLIKGSKAMCMWEFSQALQQSDKVG